MTEKTNPTEAKAEPPKLPAKHQAVLNHWAEVRTAYTQAVEFGEFVRKHIVLRTPAPDEIDEPEDKDRREFNSGFVEALAVCARHASKFISLEKDGHVVTIDQLADEFFGVDKWKLEDARRALLDIQRQYNAAQKPH